MTSDIRYGQVNPLKPERKQRFIAVGVAAAVGAINAAVAGTSILVGASVSAGLTAVGWGIRKIQDNFKPKGSGGGSGIASGSETAVNGGVQTAAHVLGRHKTTDADHMLAWAGLREVPNNRRLVDLFYVVSDGPCEGVERIYIDDYIAMDGTPNGAIQVLTVNTDAPADAPEDVAGKNWKTRFVELRNERIAEQNMLRPTDPNREGIGAREALADIRMDDYFRFLALNEVLDTNRSVSDRVDLTGTNAKSDIGNFGTWARAWIYPNGITDDQYIRSSGVINDPEWETTNRFDGLCVVHLQLEKSDLDSPFGSGIPKVDFLVKGKRITWPGQTTPTWTENAAAIRYWFHHEIEGIPANKFDVPSFTEAYNKCEETVTFTTTDPALQTQLDSYTSTIKRYTINGLILQEPDFYDQYATDMDMAWQGEVLESRGKLLFRPGFDRPDAFTIGENNTVETTKYVPQPPENDRINSVKATLQQSADNDYEPLDLPVIRDQPAITRDLGVIKEREISALRFIKYPIMATYILHIALRKNRATARLQKKIQITPTDFDGNRYGMINALDICPVTDPELGLTDAKHEIIMWRRNDDWTIDVTLKEYPADLYALTLDIPPIKPRVFRLPDDTTPPPAVTGLSAVPLASIARDGTLQLELDIHWDNYANWSTEIDIINSDGTYEDSHVGGGGVGLVRVSVPEVDTYTIIARYINQNGRLGRTEETTATIDISGLKPPPPVLRSASVRGGDITMFFEPFQQVNYDIAGIDFRYRVRGVEDTTAWPADPTEAQWDTLNRLAGDPIVPGLDGFSVALQIPFGGRYRIYARSFTRGGLESDIVRLGNEYLLAGATSATGTSESHPEWRGTLSNLGQLWSDTYTDDDGNERDIANALVHDRPDASALTYDDWNGSNGWPFGKEASATYTDEPIQFDSVGNYEIRPIYTTWTPNNTTPALTISYQGRVNGANVGNAVTAGAGFTQFRNINEVVPTVTITSRDTALSEIQHNWNATI